MQRTRNRRVNDPVYEEYLADRAKEEAAEKAAQETAAAQDPTVMYQQVANQEAEASRQSVLSGVLNDEYLSQFGTIVRQPFNESQVEVAMDQFMAETPDYVQTRANAKVLTEFLWRNNISPAACGSYRLTHAILRLWNGYPDLEKPVAQPKVLEVAAEPVLTPSERAAKKYHDDHTIIVVTDPDTGRQFTEYDLSQLNAVAERRLRRIAEKGTSFGSVYEGFLDVKDVQFARDQDIANRAAEEDDGLDGPSISAGQYRQ
jgi:hypothetical protein